MLVMYGVTVFFATAVWLAINTVFGKGPIDDHGVALMCYGCIFSASFMGVWWNVVNFKKFRTPPPLDVIRIPWAAIVLGANSAYYNVRFSHSSAQALLNQLSTKVVWFSIEAALVIALIIGIYRWEVRRGTLSTTKIVKGGLGW